MYLQSRVVPRDRLHMAVGAPGGESLAEQEFEVHAMCIVCASVLPALRSSCNPVFTVLAAVDKNTSRCPLDAGSCVFRYQWASVLRRSKVARERS